MTSGLDRFSEQDLDQLTNRGMDPDDVAEQLDLFEHPPAGIVLDRPCTVGDGILVLEETRHADLLRRADSIMSTGRTAKFVPASGAATRMFGTLLPYVTATPTLATITQGAASDRGMADLLAFWRGLRELPFLADLEKALKRRGLDPARVFEDEDLHGVLETLLDPAQMGYADLPKGLIKFHRYPDGARTSFEEQLREAAEYARGSDGVSKLHFTVSPEHRRSFESLLADVRFALSAKLRTSFHVTWSIQSPSSDTIAVGMDNRPLREADGTLQFRQGGHGALIWNLAAIDSEIVFIKNIDNVVPDPTKPLVTKWKKLLLGTLAEVQERVFGALRRLDAGDVSPVFFGQCFDLLEKELLVAPGEHRSASDEARAAFLVDRLDRPLRVCGVVRNEGEPGGGPFWVRGTSGDTSLQIVESSQIRHDVADQRNIAREATHFNPVDIVCGLRSWRGARFDLARHVDPSTAFIASKAARGREIKVLERPGLWNGAMAGWNTVFVEVPVETFAPVKSVLDLLRPAHQRT